MRVVLVAILVLMPMAMCFASGQQDADSTSAAALEDYQSWNKVNMEPVTGDETGLLGRAHEGADGVREVYVNDVGRPVSFGEAALPYPQGTILVKESYSGARELTGITVMVKRAGEYDPENGNWEYMNLNAAGKISGQGRISSCIACHSAAESADWVFTSRR